MEEMVPAPQQQAPNAPSSGGSPLKWVILLVVAIIALTGGVFVLSRSKPSTQKQTAQITNKTATSPSNVESKIKISPTQPYQYAQRTNIPKQVVCYRFTDLREALLNIEAACILDLSGQNLTQVPAEINKLTKLNTLSLSDNKLTVFPSELLNIKTLVSLDLSNNSVSLIPSGTQIPSTIQSLKLSGNKLSASDIQKYERVPGVPQPSPTIKK